LTEAERPEKNNYAIDFLAVGSITGRRTEVTCNHFKLRSNFAGAKPANGLQISSRQKKDL